MRLLAHLRAPAERREPADPLTTRELEVARSVARGATNAEIAAELFLSPGTVKNHLASIQRKLGVRNRVAVAAWAWDTGRVGPETEHNGPRRSR